MSRRLSPLQFERLAIAAVLALAFIIVTGGAVRLTGSGLGCPNWPTCTGHHLVAPDTFHPMVEFTNRVVTAAVSLAIVAAAVGALLRAPRRRDLTWLSMGLVLGLVAEIVLGGETVKHRLEPGFVMSHFLLSMLMIWDAVVLWHRAGWPDGQPRAPLVSRELVWIGRLVAAMAGVTVVIGTIVTGAGPHSGANSSNGQVVRWQLDLHQITELHGTSAMLFLALVVTMLWLLWSQHAPQIAQVRCRQLLEALCIQVAIGYTQYFTGVPAWLVAFHILGAVTVWVAALRLALALATGAPACATPPTVPAVTAAAA